jgi:hypothetical protein
MSISDAVVLLLLQTQTSTNLYQLEPISYAVQPQGHRSAVVFAQEYQSGTYNHGGTYRRDTDTVVVKLGQYDVLAKEALIMQRYVGVVLSQRASVMVMVVVLCVHVLTAAVQCDV